jgi:hypothetical protein
VQAFFRGLYRGRCDPALHFPEQGCRLVQLTHRNQAVAGREIICNAEIERHFGKINTVQWVLPDRVISDVAGAE